MPFVGEIFAQLKAAGSTTVLQEIRDGQVTAFTGGQVLELVGQARAFLSGRGLKKGDRAGLLAHNGMRWVAMDLALMAEGRSNTAIAESLFVTPGAVEKHITSIFAKLDLAACDEDHRRVLAVLAYLRVAR